MTLNFFSARRVLILFGRAQILSAVIACFVLSAAGDNRSLHLETVSRVAATDCNFESLPPERKFFTIQDAPLTKIAAEASKGVGKVVAAGQGSANRTIFVFEEKHDSRIGQLEIAVMLWRLEQSQGLRRISVEGTIAANGDLPVRWFHDLAREGGAKRAGQIAAVRLLREGEINAAEFMTLMRPAVQVRGSEIESEYGVEPSDTNAALGYLVAIAEQSLTTSDAQRVNGFVKAQRTDEAMEAIFSNDSWSRERYLKLYGEKTASSEEAVGILREVEARARELGLKIDPQQRFGFRQDLNFYQTASRRSCTIVKNTLELFDAAGNAPVALLIGATHTEKVVELIKGAQLSYVVLSPLSLVAEAKAARLASATQERKSRLQSVDEAGMLGAFLDRRKKPPSVLNQQWLQSKAEIYATLDLVLAAASRNERLPSSAVISELQSFQSIRLDWSSIEITWTPDQVRVVYRVTAQTRRADPEQSVDVWVGGWQQFQPPLPQASGSLVATGPVAAEGLDAEKMILDALAEDKSKTQREDVRVNPGEMTWVRLTPQTRAAFSIDPTLLQRATGVR